MTTVPRIGRILDVAGLALFLGGAGFVVRSWFGFKAVQEYQSQPGDPLFAAIHIADGFWRLQKIGVALMVVGVAVFVLAWWVAGRATPAVGKAPEAS